MCHHFVKGGIGVLRLLDPDDLNLVELMESVESAHVLTVGTGLAAEAGSVGCHLLGHLVALEYDIPEYVGHRDLCCRYKVEIIQADMVHLSLLVRKLAGTKT